MPPQTSELGDDVNVEEDTPQNDPQKSTTDLITSYTLKGGNQGWQTLCLWLGISFENWYNDDSDVVSTFNKDNFTTTSKTILVFD